MSPDVTRKIPLLLHLVASTGRTATSLIAQALDGLGRVAACHEGHRGNDEGGDLLPLINLDNLRAYRSADEAAAVVASKRSAEIIADAMTAADVDVVIDVAYYNSVIASAVLDAYRPSRLVAIIRDCESFVRSVTWLEGEDPMPVGWPEPAKPLSNRERFISMGRLRPLDGRPAELWSHWGAIERNIWLWCATNERLLDACDAHPDRATVVDFALLPADSDEFFSAIVRGLGLDIAPPEGQTWGDVAETASSRMNKRVGGYQVGPASTWTPEQREMLIDAQAVIDERIIGVRH